MSFFDIISACIKFVIGLPGLIYRVFPMTSLFNRFLLIGLGISLIFLSIKVIRSIISSR